MASVGNRVFNDHSISKGPATINIPTRTTTPTTPKKLFIIVLHFSDLLLTLQFGQLLLDGLVLAALPYGSALLVDPPYVLLTVRAPRPKWQAPAEL